MRLVRRSTRTTRWRQSSFTATSPLGSLIASDGRSSRFLPRRGAEGPGHAARPRHLDHAARGRERANEDVAVRKELRVGGIGEGRPNRPDESSGAVEPIDPAADLRHQDAAVREWRVAVRAREPAGRVVDATPAEHAQDRAVVPQLDDPAVADVGHRRRPVGEAVGVVRCIRYPLPRPGTPGGRTTRRYGASVARSA